MLTFENLHAYYGSSHILHDISFTVGQGEVVAVLGRNGVGKTTLLRSIMGLVDRTTGSIVMDGTKVSSLPTHERARAGIAYVPQGREIIPGFTVQENLLLGGYARRDGKTVQQVPDLIWELFPALREHVNRRGTSLSGGQQQQLAIARAMMMEPDVLLLDEPTEGVQPNVVDHIESTITRLNRELGKTVVVVEQKIDFARAVATSFVMMEKGAVAAKGERAQLTDDLVNRHMAV